MKGFESVKHLITQIISVQNEFHLQQDLSIYRDGLYPPLQFQTALFFRPGCQILTSDPH